MKPILIQKENASMKIIGEKINGTINSVKEAIEKRDGNFIQKLALSQAQAGASWLDVNAGTLPEKEPEDLAWLAKVAQEVSDLPLCLDSANKDALAHAVKKVNKTPMINSISCEPDRLKEILPIASHHNCDVIALTMDGNGIPKDATARFKLTEKILKATRKSGLSDDKIYIDPLVTALATGTDSGIIAFETMKKIKLEFPRVHFTMGLSNISFGLPNRSVVNRTFMTLSMACGLDSAIMDPLDRELAEAIVTAELVLGKDDFCINYTRAFRENRALGIVTK